MSNLKKIFLQLLMLNPNMADFRKRLQHLLSSSPIQMVSHLLHMCCLDFFVNYVIKSQTLIVYSSHYIAEYSFVELMNFNQQIVFAEKLEEHL